MSIEQIAGSGGGGGCFAAGTLVQLEHGKTIPIEQLKVGDDILSFDEKGGIHISKVVEVHTHEKEPIINVQFWDGEINITSNHWVLNQYGAFVEIGRLTTHDALVDGMGHLRPIKGAKFHGNDKVYNLTVEPNHTFIANNIRVHNGGYRERYPVAGSGGGGGGGKGGGGSRASVESPDTLFSTQYARVIDLVSEGEIVGLENGLQSVYLDGSPLRGDNGVDNFRGITVISRPGTQSQEYIPGFTDVEVEVPVSTRIKKGNATTTTGQTSGAAWVSISAQDSTPRGMAFSSDGYKLFVVGQTTNKVYQYNLSEPWNFTDAVYADSFVTLTTEDKAPIDLAFSPDGSKLYVLGMNTAIVYQYNLTSPWTLTGATHSTPHKFSFSPQDAWPRGIAVHSDGVDTYMFVTGHKNDKVYRYKFLTGTTLIVTLTYDGVFKAVQAEDNVPIDAAFSTDGLKMYVIGQQNDKIYQYTLGTPWNISTATYANKAISISEHAADPIGLAVSSDGNHIYFTNSATKQVYRYSMDTPWDISTASYPSPLVVF